MPGFEFLRRQPHNVRNQLLAIVDAVRTTGPDGWRDPQTHRPMKGHIDQLHEARDKQGETLYRLFLLWQRNERRVVVLDGRVKPNNTALADKEYAEIGELAEAAMTQPSPFAVADDFVRVELAHNE